MLAYPPFAASSQMRDADPNHPPLSLSMKGPGVALLQGGLVQMGIPLPLTMKKGAPDGSFGPETLAGVRTFQRLNKLSPADGIAGHDTVALLDNLLAKAAGPLPRPCR
jgi:peptidoglycan hydrolase-like protein with peptidoglycan-binding domain